MIKNSRHPLGQACLYTRTRVLASSLSLPRYCVAVSASRRSYPSPPFLFLFSLRTRARSLERVSRDTANQGNGDRRWQDRFSKAPAPNRPRRETRLPPEDDSNDHGGERLDTERLSEIRDRNCPRGKTRRERLFRGVASSRLLPALALDR